MHVFHGIVRLEGSLNNEVYKRGLTVPEVLILNKIHDPLTGQAVVKLKHAGEIEDFDDEEERERLTYMYDQGLGALHEDYKTSVKKMFSEYGPLPAKLSTYNGPMSDEVDELEDFQAPEPYASPNAMSMADERKARKEERKAARVAGEKANAAPRVPARNNKKSSESNIEAVL